MQYWRNIDRYWECVSADDISAGEAAYPAYWEMMRRVAERYGIDQTLVTEAFAALSPNNDYLGNLRSLVSVVEAFQKGTVPIVTTYNACARRAMSYLSGEVDFLSTVEGKKITAFRNCIVDPHGCDEFVLDGHMIAIALGCSMTMSQANLALRSHGYDKISSAYRRFSKRKDLRVPVLQATLWFCRKRTERILHTTQKDFFRDDARLLYRLDEIPAYTPQPRRKPTNEISDLDNRSLPLGLRRSDEPLRGERLF